MHIETQTIFNILYGVAFCSYILLSVFIVYHLVRYSMNKTVLVFSVSFFLIGTLTLLSLNAFLFFSLPLDQFLFNTLPSLSQPSVIQFPNSPF